MIIRVTKYSRTSLVHACCNSVCPAIANSPLLFTFKSIPVYIIKVMFSPV